MSDSDLDFGKILDQWEGGPRRDDTGGTGSSGASRDLEQWLDKHPPPDKDEVPENGERHQKRRNPLKMKVDDELDLHGFRLDEARTLTEEFVAQSVRNGFRKILIIHGKGENGEGVLRREIRGDLERNPLTGAMGYNRGTDGGRGALWVILRQGSRDDSESDAYRSR